MVSQLICDDYIYMHHLAKKTIYWYRLENLWRAILEYQNRTLYSNYFKVENFLKGSLDSIPLPYVLHLQWKFKLWMGKFAWGVKAKHCWALLTNFWKQEVCWHHPAMLCPITSSKVYRKWFDLKVKVMGFESRLLKYFLL